jgi:hypothetical protein
MVSRAAIRSSALALVAACGGLDHPVVVWGGENHFTRQKFQLGNGGEASLDISNGDHPEHKHYWVQKQQVGEFHDMLRDKNVCALKSDPSYEPVPDEQRTYLELHFPDIQCRVELWDQEWGKRDDSKDIDAAIRALEK